VEKRRVIPGVWCSFFPFLFFNFVYFFSIPFFVSLAGGICKNRCFVRGIGSSDVMMYDAMDSFCCMLLHVESLDLSYAVFLKYADPKGPLCGLYAFTFHEDTPRELCI
jgi:hypothetical protein